MRIAICSIGTELLSGDQVDTNSAWLSSRLRELGAEVVLHLGVGDALDQMVDALRLALDRADGVIVGGGLGPTPDDMTRKAIAAAAGVSIAPNAEMQEAIIQKFADFGGRMSPNNLRQAELPAGARAFPPVGTAPGFVLEVGGKPVFALPGVPWELQSMFDEHVAPLVLEQAGGQARVTRVMHVTAMGESSVAQALEAVEKDATQAGIEVAYLATRSEIQVKLTATGATREAAHAAGQVFVDRVCHELGVAVAGVDEVTVEEALVALLAELGRTVATAESATAGLVAARIADVPGASTVFSGGQVVYETRAKVDVAGVDASLLDEHPAVSAEVTRALAVRARETFGTDYGVATTGVAGPDLQDGVEVGQCYWAVAGPTTPGGEVTGRKIPGDRQGIRGRLATAALEMLRRQLLLDRAG